MHRHRVSCGLIAAGLLCLQTLGSHSAMAQDGSFSRCIILPLDYTPQSVAQISPSGIIVLSDDGLHSYLFQKGALTASRSYTLARPVSGLSAVTLSVSPKSFEVVAPSRDGHSILWLKGSHAGLQERIVPAEVGEGRIAIADINNDKRPDIVIFGRSTSGVSVLYGTAKGTFSAPDNLFPDVSASDLATADLNRDGITDVLLLDWLANRLIIFYGIGQSVFSEQISIPLPGEPSRIAISPPNRRRVVVVGITVPEAKRVLVVTRDVTGEFYLSDTISVGARPDQLAFADVNGDGRVDVIVASAAGVDVSLSDSTGAFPERTTFGVGTAPSFALGDCDGDKTVDLAAVDRQSKRLAILANDRTVHPDQWPSMYAVGATPRGVAARDLDGDGTTDIVVANGNSSTLSVLLNRGDGVMAGQRTVPVNEHPTFIRATSDDAIPATVVTSHTGSDQLTVVRLTGTRAVSYTVPTGPQPYVVFANEDRGNLNMIVRYAGAKKVSLSLFEQIQQAQFIERNLTPSRKIGAVNVEEQPGGYRLVYSSFDPAQSSTTIFTASSNSGFTFGAVRALFSYEDSSNATRTLYPGPIDRDGLSDVVAVLGEPRNAIAVAYADSTDIATGALFWIHGIQPVNADAMIIRDVDGDGINDITAVDALRKAVVTLYGKEGRRFEEPRVVFQAGDIGGIQIAAIRSKTSHDLIVTHFRRGTVEIIEDPFRR